MLEILYKPQEGINYNFIFCIYLVCTIASLVFLFIEYIIQYEILKGLWIVFAPFLPTLIWASLMRRAKHQSDKDKKLD